MAVPSSAFHVPLGTPLFDFTLPNLEGDPVSLQQLRGTGVLLIFWSANHCPYVQHLELAIADLIHDCESDPKFKAVAICSNDADQYPDDDVAGLKDQRQRAGWNFPYVLDTDQSAGREFRAACTPDFFLFNGSGRLAYRGAFDYSTPKNGEPVTGELLRDAISRTLMGREVPEPHRPSTGCGIKWKPGARGSS